MGGGGTTLLRLNRFILPDKILMVFSKKLFLYLYVYRWLPRSRVWKYESSKQPKKTKKKRRKKHRDNSFIHPHSIRSVWSSHIRFHTPGMHHRLRRSRRRRLRRRRCCWGREKKERKNERKKETSKMSKIADSYVEAAWANRLQRLARSQQRRKKHVLTTREIASRSTPLGKHMHIFLD